MLDYGLKDKVVIITGATGGIGGAIATEFYELGAQIIITGRNHEKLTALRDKLTSNPDIAPAPLCIPLDLTAAEATKSLVQETVKQFGRLDAVVNNASRVDGRRGITANCIAPGVINTDAAKKIPAARREQLRTQTPMQRFAPPEEVAFLAVFLASKRASFINGQQIHVNGGLLR